MPIVLLGFDERGKPRAGRFAGGQSALATKAAGPMGLTVCQVTPSLVEQRSFLPVGSPTGSPLVRESYVGIHAKVSA
jgi:hypothetical protein